MTVSMLPQLRQTHAEAVARHGEDDEESLHAGNRSHTFDPPWSPKTLISPKHPTPKTALNLNPKVYAPHTFQQRPHNSNILNRKAKAGAVSRAEPGRGCGPRDGNAFRRVCTRDDSIPGRDDRAHPANHRCPHATSRRARLVGLYSQRSARCRAIPIEQSPRGHAEQ